MAFTRFPISIYQFIITVGQINTLAFLSALFFCVSGLQLLLLFLATKIIFTVEIL